MAGSDGDRGGGKGIEMGIEIGRSEGNRIVIKTNVSKGLGRVLVIELLAYRSHTIIGCSCDQDKLDFLQSQLPNNNHHLFLNIDVRCNNRVEEMACIFMEKNGGPSDIIVNGAGVVNKNNKMWEVPSEEFDLVMDTNLKGAANVLRPFIPLMVKNKKYEEGGIIVNMSSGWGRSVAALVAPYCVSKWAIEGLTKSVVEELPKVMAVVALNPGVINTNMLAFCYGASSSLYRFPESWVLEAATKILNLTPTDNGSSLSI
ncbi:putative 3-oxoacyl-[acyl-carrier-protein] reductase [Medicago truncatula]|uniref:3-oxoacyl-[acyl-carrier] reductase FabG-like protein n=1 Tax=Medicago truncatula TaxID=3880 RepID=G7JHD5_MEDTR|nr:NADPH-dependent pterin aldehyde reductase [Medicago truncatula]AES89145.1 3-oxoacyl-[acyl-carrier] reductase FabG-like protein [Medicago truncatula]RHN61305.1 putative 3-oxoacyl-[acyl-carrier-protein] reductase [Medicago truncatula]